MRWCNDVINNNNNTNDQDESIVFAVNSDNHFDSIPDSPSEPGSEIDDDIPLRDLVKDTTTQADKPEKKRARKTKENEEDTTPPQVDKPQKKRAWKTKENEEAESITVLNLVQESLNVMKTLMEDNRKHSVSQENLLKALIDKL